MSESEKLLGNDFYEELPVVGVPDDTLSIISRTSNNDKPLEEEKEQSEEKFVIASSFALSGTGC